MLSRHVELRDFKTEKDDERLDDFLLNTSLESKVDALLKRLKECNEVALKH